MRREDMGVHWGPIDLLEEWFWGWVGRKGGEMLSRGPGWDADNGKACISSGPNSSLLIHGAKAGQENLTLFAAKQNR